MCSFEAIIFDCDGVLFESHRANLAYYNKIFAHFGHPLVLDPTTKEAQICHTYSSPAVLEQLMGPAKVEAALDFAGGIDYREFIPLMTEAEGLMPTIARLADDYPLAVATNRGGSMLEILDHFGLADHFKVVVTSKDVEKPKPAPDMLLLAASRLERSPQNCVFIGDSILDLQAAQLAGMPFIAYGDSIIADQSVCSHFELERILRNLAD